MLIAGLDPFQVIGAIVAIVAGIGAIVGAIAGAIYIVKSHKLQADDDIADRAVLSLQATLAALEARLDVNEKERKHCDEMRRQQDLVISELKGSMSELRSWVTARDLITDLTNLTRSGFIALGTDPKALEVASAGN
jgi:hypothetical protein